MWQFRPALPDEAEEICTVLRRSIEELCVADHGGAPDILAAWLANKTPEQVLRWIEGNPHGVLVAVGPDGGVAGVGAVIPRGEIALNYVAPWARYRGVSTGLLSAMERLAESWGNSVCTLTSTATARQFYKARGYEEVGSPIASFGDLPAFPMRRTIR